VADALDGASAADSDAHRGALPESTVFNPLLSANPKGEAAVGSLTL